MSDLSRNKPGLRLSVILGLIGLGILPLSAWGQSAAPPSSAPAPGAPLLLGPTENPTPPADPAPSVPGEAPLTTQPLSPVGTAVIGLIGEGEGGLGADLWSGSTLSWLSSLLPRLPAPVASPPLRDLQRRLLLTKAAAPEADIAIGGPDPLIPLRAERLRAMGLVGDAQALEQAGAGIDLPPGDPRLAIEARLKAGDNKGACLEIDRQMQAAVALDLFLSRAALFCTVLRGDKESAAIGRDLLREREDLDPVARDFVALISAMLGDAPHDQIALSAEPDVLNIAVLREAGLDAILPGEGETAEIDPALDGALARDPQYPLSERLAAGRRALTYGLLSAEELAALYRTYPRSDTDPFLLAGAKSTPENDALLYQAVAAGQLPERRAHLIALLLAGAIESGDLSATAALYAPIAAEIAPNEGLVWFAPTALRLAILSGDLDLAGQWMNLAERVGANATAPNAAKIAPALPAMRLLARLAGLADREAGTYDVAQAWQLASQAPSEIGQFYGAALDAVAPAAAGTIAEAPIKPGENSPAALIAPALSGGKRGEGIALILIALDDGNAFATDKGAVLAAIQGLVAAGLAGEARAILCEIAIRNGL